MPYAFLPERRAMALGPNQTGSVLQSPMSNMLGYGNSLVRQTQDSAEEKRKKAQRDAAASAAAGMPPAISGMMGY